ncbi:MAG: Na+/H+ antiporter subunit E [Spirochaetes bacterium]|nr:Na+/H+ antiporter subunit E [Spirochaetota bacterium]
MKYIILFIIGFIFFLGLAGSFDTPYLIAGFILSFLTSLIFGRYFLAVWPKVINPIRYFWFLIYIPVFLWECFKANLDVAYRVLHPGLPIKPGIVKVRTRLKTDIAKVFLANSITMTPGTLSIDIIDDYLYIHWINVASRDPAVYTKKIAGRFEKLLVRIFE